MCETRANMGRRILPGDSEEGIEQEEEASGSSSSQLDKPRRTKRSQLRSATSAKDKAIMTRSAAFERLPFAPTAKSLDTYSPSASEDRTELELEEVDLGGQEVLEGPEVELLLYSLVRNYCRMGRRRKLEVEL